MPIKSNREYRVAQPFIARDDEYIVEGYAATFEPYEMWRDEEGRAYYERIEPTAFDNADMSDVIMQYNHEGRVFARQSNGTLELSVDDHGLKIRANLSSTQAARELYDEIKAGLTTQMSFAFTVEEDDFDRDTRTRVISRIRKVYDVSAVSIPANPDTEISARSYFAGVAEQEAQERRKAEERDRQKRKIKILLEVRNNGTRKNDD